MDSTMLADSFDRLSNYISLRDNFTLSMNVVTKLENNASKHEW